jgi:hypothetical protein
MARETLGRLSAVVGALNADTLSLGVDRAVHLQFNSASAHGRSTGSAR